MFSAGSELPILTVSQLTESIKIQLERGFPFVIVQGEVSNCKVQSSGHVYFSLKDAGAQISAVMFRLDAAKLIRSLKDGDQVIVKGSLNVYPPSGKYQIICQELKLAGIGELLLKLEELKIKLHKMGFFRSERKRPIPKFPKRIGVVTSPTGAAIQDIMHVLTRRALSFHLILYPVKVQGDGAAYEIAKAIDDFNRFSLTDVLIVGRGGGSIEDLWAFNEEIVAQSIFKSQIPIISAVGHETDHSIADYVADLRAPTPSAAAEIVLAETEQLLKTLSHFENGIKKACYQVIKSSKEKLNTIKRLPQIQSPYLLLGASIQKLDDLKNSMSRKILEILSIWKVKLAARAKEAHLLKPDVKMAQLKQKILYLDNDLKKIFKIFIEEKKNRLNRTIDLLKASNPKNLLSKGYSIIFSEKEGLIINSIRDLKKEEKVKILFADGEAYSTINEIKASEPRK